MANKYKTGFDSYLDKRMQDPAFADEYAKASSDITKVNLVMAREVFKLEQQLLASAIEALKALIYGWEGKENDSANNDSYNKTRGNRKKISSNV